MRHRYRRGWLVVAAFWGGFGVLTSKVHGQSPEFQSAGTAPPRVLLLGDSISLGYTPAVRHELGEAAAVVRPQLDGQDENCAGTTHGVASLERWLASAGDPQVIVFNFGLHDLKHIDPQTGAGSEDPQHPRQAEPPTYEAQLRTIAERLLQTRAHLIFVTTTPVPSGGVRPFRRVGDPLLYNGMARAVVEPLGIAVVDLWGIAAPQLAAWQQPSNVHFNEVGSQELGNAVASAVRPYLDAPRPDRTRRAWQADPQLVARLSQSGEVLYDEAAVPPYELPALASRQTAHEGGAVEAWAARRNELLEVFRSQIYGRVPAAAEGLRTVAVVQQVEEGLCSGAIEGRLLEIQVQSSAAPEARFSFPVLLYRPRQIVRPPVVLLIENRQRPQFVEATTHPSEFLPIELLAEFGFAVAVFHTSDVEPDRQAARAEGIRGWVDRLGGATAERPDDWGALSAWAWGASRVLDVLQNEPAVDGRRVGIVGHSRGGKTALWAAAQDERFAAAISNESGCLGAALSRRQYGERVGRIGAVFPFWFCPAFQQFAGRETALPVDQHQLLALVAPRPLYVASAGDDLWADPRGEYLGLVAAAPAFAGTGVPGITDPEMPASGETRVRGTMGYHVRPGPHDLTAGDWVRFAQFLRQQLAR